MRLFSIKHWPGGHIHIGLLNWHITYSPTRMTWWWVKRPWPWATRGLNSTEQRSFHRPSRKQLTRHLK